MAIIHGYIDTKNGNIGYQGDLEDDDAPGGYIDASVEPPLKGQLADLKYLRVGRHLFEFVSGVQMPAHGRWNYLSRYPGFIHDAPTNN